MKTTQRDQALLMIMPAIAVAAIYVLGPMVSTAGQKLNPQGQLTQLDKKIADARMQVPSPATLQMLRMGAARDAKQVAELAKNKSELEKAWRELQPGQKLPRSELALRITSLLARHKITTLSHSLSEKEEQAMPASLKSALNALQGKAKGRYLRLDVQGNYQDLLASLKELAETNEPTIPISLTMEQASLDTTARRWTLILWL